MRNKSKLLLKKFIFYGICAVVILSACNHSKEKTEKPAGMIISIRPIPFMWIPKEKSVERTLWFKFGRLSGVTESKEELLTDYVGKTHKAGYSYSLKSFDSLLTLMNSQNPVGVRVYFGAFDEDHQPVGVPIDNNTPEGQIILIFAPTDASHKDLNKYYIFGPNNYPYSITPAAATTLIGNYQFNEGSSQNVLAVTVEQNVTENLDNNTNKTTDTKSILYCYSDFKDFIQLERTYQNNSITYIADSLHTTAVLIDSIAIDFASLPDTGVSTIPLPSGLGFGNPAFKNRLHVLYGFTRKGAPYYIDDSPDFYTRHQIPQATTACPDFYDEKILKFRTPFMGGGGADNGQLCPPYNCQ
jgi:hypothetical protein